MGAVDRRYDLVIVGTGSWVATASGRAACRARRYPTLSLGIGQLAGEASYERAARLSFLVRSKA